MQILHILSSISFVRGRKVRFYTSFTLSVLSVRSRITKQTEDALCQSGLVLDPCQVNMPLALQADIFVGVCMYTTRACLCICACVFVCARLSACLYLCVNMLLSVRACVLFCVHARAIYVRGHGGPVKASISNKFIYS